VIDFERWSDRIQQMKKTFILTHPKIKYDRLVEAVRRDIRRYMKRERGKKLPDGFDFWDFDCKFGVTEEDAGKIHPSEFNKCITRVQEQGIESIYVEILAKPGKRVRKPVEKVSGLTSE
jgi:hypothetical protein